MLVQYLINVKPLFVAYSPRPDEVMLVRYVQPLTDEQRGLLEKAMKEDTAFRARSRAHSLWLSAGGTPIQTIAKTYQVYRVTVSAWIKKEQSAYRLGCVKIPFFKVYEQHRAFLSRSCLAHNLATVGGLLLALRHAGLTIRLKVIDCKWTIVVHMRVKRQHQRWTLPYDPHTGVAMTMDPAFVSFRTFEPTLQVQIVDRKLSYLTPHKQPRFKAAHDLGKVLFNGIRAGLPLLL